MAVTSYRRDGALLLDKLFPGFGLDVKIYEIWRDFDLDDYKMGKDDRLMVRTFGSNSPNVRNPDIIVKNTADALKFMKRQAKKNRFGYIGQRTMNENDIKYSVSGSLDYRRIPSLAFTIREVDKGFILNNMETDERGTTTREAKVLVEFKYDYFSATPKAPSLSPPNFPKSELRKLKKTVLQVVKFAKIVDDNYTKNYAKKDLMPNFLLYVSKKGDILPVDLKQKYNLKSTQRKIWMGIKVSPSKTA
ncbi:MAG: hypothetical protein ABIG20_05060 [archaeon]